MIFARKLHLVDIVDTLGIALETSHDFPMIFPMKFQVLPQVLDPADREVMNLIKVMNHIKATIAMIAMAMWVKRT